MRKRWMALAMTICILGSCLQGCGQQAEHETQVSEAESEDSAFSSTEALVDTSEIENSDGMQWDAKWIWGNFNENDSWLLARKSFQLEEAPKEGEAIAYISADSKYWLYVNGELVVRDGGLKRGQTTNSIYYDKVDLSSYLKAGENVIGIRTWYWGPTGSYSYISSGQGALYFQMEVGGKQILSDETWKVRRDPAFSNEHNEANYRLPENDIYYIAAQEQDGWLEEDYKIPFFSSWMDAVVIGVAGSEPWGQLVERTIPLFVDSDETDYSNASEMPWTATGSYTTTSKEVFVMKLPYNAQVYPILSVDAEEGKAITMKSDMYADQSGNSVMTTYVTKAGEQTFETPGWMNGEVIYYEIPEGVTIHSLTYRETGYDTTLNHAFSSSDDFYNEIWQKAQRTVYVNMRDNYMDCPNRERAGWIGDASLDMLISMYSMGTSAQELFRSDLLRLIGNRQGNMLWTVNSSETQTEIQMQLLMMIPEIYEYYLYTGDLSVIEEAYQPLQEYLLIWQANEEGIYEYSLAAPRWDWGDSTEEVDYAPLENAWLYGAFDALEKMAILMDRPGDAEGYVAKKEALRNAYQAKFWTEAGFQSEGFSFLDERANAAAVISGIATPEEYPVIASILESQFHGTPFLEYYVEKACCLMGRNDLALMRMKKQYDCMINAAEGEETSTLWEYFNYAQGSKNHGWAAGPLLILSRYVVGIEPLEAGYSRYAVKPQLGDLTNLLTTVETVAGEIQLAVTAFEEDDSWSMNLTQPEGLTAYVAVQKMSEKPKVRINGTTVYSKGQMNEVSIPGVSVTFVSEDESYLYFELEGTNLSILSE